MIKVDNLCVKTLAHRVLLNHINFELDNDFAMLSGASGSGKSLLSRCLCGMSARDLQIKGNIIIDNKTLPFGYLEKKDYRKQRLVNIIFQNPARIMNKSLSVEDHIHEASLFLDKNFAKNQVQWILDYFQFDSVFLQKYPNMLSEGEKQRVVVAMCLLQRPKLIIADELVSSLDDENGLAVMHLLVKIHKEHHISILLISHQEYPILDEIITKKLHIKDGKLI